jgi:hypothetical protein
MEVANEVVESGVPKETAHSRIETRKEKCPWYRRTPNSAKVPHLPTQFRRIRSSTRHPIFSI